MLFQKKLSEKKKTCIPSLEKQNKIPLFLFNKIDLISQRQMKLKASSLSFLAVDLDILSMIHDDLFYYRKTQPHACLIKASGFISFMKALKDMLERLLVHTNPCIFH